MKLKTPYRALTLAAMLGATSLVSATAAFADDATYATQDTFLKTADEALSAVTQVQAARLALFENDIPTAKGAVETAKTSLMAAESDLADKLMRDFTLEDSTTNYLPFDMSMTLTDGFTASEENKLAVQKAYGLFESAEPNDAVEVLKLAEIDVQVTAALLPYEATLTALDDAIGNIEDGDYFDANLDLKSIADSILMREFSIDAVPVQGAQK